MCFASLALLGLVNIESRNLDLLDGGAQAWSAPDRATRCPVHSKVQPVAADDGKGVSFVVEATSFKRFSVVDKYLPAGGLAGYQGLQLNFTTNGLGTWRFRVYDSTCRFAYYITKPAGAHSLTLPWSSFRPEQRRRKTITSGYTIQPSSISHLAVVLPNGPQQAQLTLQGLHAMGNMAAIVATSAASDDAVKGFDGPFFGMGISGHNDFQMIAVNSPAECAEACTKIAECRSFDYGARGQVLGECWRSLADRQSAGYAYQSWGLYNYYEVKRESSNTASTIMTSSAIILSKADMAAVMGYFEGPFVGMGISGHNDFELVSVNDPAECADLCTKTPECSSFDYGARGNVLGECWQSRADRKSAGSAYKSWALYDYFEFKATANATTVENAKENAKKDEDETAVVKTEARQNAKKDEDETTVIPTYASHAQRLTSRPIACVQAIVVLIVFMAS
jgi:hypothetical protein